MLVRFENPAWLLVAAMAIPAGWMALRWFMTMSRIRRWSAAVARAALLALIASLLAGAVSVHRTNRLAVVAVIDVSESVRRFARPDPETGAQALEAVRSFLAKAATGRGGDDLLGVVVFDGRALAVATPSRADPLERPIDLTMREGTDIEAALRYASALIPPDAAGRIVLFSDGNETSGHAATGAAELASRFAGVRGSRSRLPVDVVPLEYDVRSEVAVEAVDTPPSAAAGAVVPVRVTLSAAGPAEGILRLSCEGQELDINGEAPGLGRMLRLAPGRHVELIEAPLQPGRVHRFEAVWEPRVETLPDGSTRFVGDTSIDNNRAPGITLTPGQGEVLVVDGPGGGSRSGPGATLVRTLEAAGLAVSLIGPEGLPGDLVSLQQFDLVVLEDVAADAVPEQTQAALATVVKQLGTGLVIIGGPDSFAPGGWKGSTLAEVIPVDMDIPDELIVPTAAVMLVLDASGSMGRSVMGSIRSQQEIANEAAALAVGALDKRDLVGVLAFDNFTREVVPLSPNTDAARTGEKIRGIGPGGGTVIGPALERAEEALRAVQAEVRYVVLLSDGQAMDAEILPDLAERMGRSGIRVTTISVGSGADLQTMSAIAARSGGKHYVVTNPNVLPRIFIKAIRVVRTPLIREVPFVPRLLPTGSPLLEGLAEAPPLNGLVLTRARPETTIINAMVTAKGEPVLSHWQVGLGQVAAFTSDARADEWAARWAPDPSYAAFWTRVVRTLSRPTTPGPYELRMDRDGSAVVLRLEATDEQGRPIDFLSVPASAFSQSGAEVDLSLAQIGPGLYEGRIDPVPTGQLVAIVRPSLGGRPLPPVVGGMTIAGGEEFRTLKSNDALLRNIAEATGGRVLSINNPQQADLFDRADLPPRVTSVPIFLPLMLATLALFVLDVATRRVAWDRFVSKEFGADLRRAAAEATRSRGEQAGRALAGLKSGRSHPAEPAAPAPTLGDESATDLIAQARDRRAKEESERLRRLREEMLGEHPRDAAPQAPTTPEPPEDPEESGTGGLLAAKRRARERYEGDPES